MHQSIRSPHPVAATAIALAILSSATTAQTGVVSPSDRTALEGSSFSHFPLGRFNARMQQLHADVPGGTVITGQAFRADAIQLRSRVDAFAAELSVTLSMSPNTPNRASSTFANNVGSNPVVVLPRTVVSFGATDRPGIDPAPGFEFVVPYQTPFVVPPGGGTLCVDISMYGNLSAGGADRNLSIFLDAHESYTDGRNEQPGYRLGQGCAAPGRTVLPHATMSLWHRGTTMSIDVAARNGIADDGSGIAQAFLALGVNRQAWPWPSRPDCLLQSSTEVWFALPGTMNTQGNYDGSLTGLPVLPPGHRLWLQSGSVHLGNGSLAFGDLSTLVTPPAGTLPIAASRVVNSTDRNAATGSVAMVATVTRFL